MDRIQVFTTYKRYPLWLSEHWKDNYLAHLLKIYYMKCTRLLTSVIRNLMPGFSFEQQKDKDEFKRTTSVLGDERHCQHTAFCDRSAQDGPTDGETVVAVEVISGVPFRGKKLDRNFRNV